MVPTLTVIVPAVPSAAVIANAVLCAGSVARGYVWVVAVLSRAQVNPHLLAPIVTVLEVVSTKYASLTVALKLAVLGVVTQLVPVAID